MSIYNQSTTTILWCVQPLLQLTTVAVLWRRKIHKHFRVFFAFLLIQVVFFVATFSVFGRSSIAYFWIFWLQQAVNAVLGFKIIHEIFLDVFRPYHALQDLGTPVFKWAGAVMVLVAIVVAASNSFAESPIIHAILTLQRSVRTVQFGLILFLVIFARFLGISRRQLCFGISLGFGLFAGAELLLLATFSGGIIGENLLNILNMFAYDVSVIAWIGYACAAKVEREKVINPLRTQRWEKSLGDLRPRDEGNSLIPMFEGMVERAFSKSATVDSDGELAQMERDIKDRLAKSAGAGSQGNS